MQMNCTGSKMTTVARFSPTDTSFGKYVTCLSTVWAQNPHRSGLLSRFSRHWSSCQEKWEPRHHLRISRKISAAGARDRGLELKRLVCLGVKSSSGPEVEVPAGVESDGKKQRLQQQEGESEVLVPVLKSVRAQVVAMLALALVLCNADRVIMSVAIVPLSVANGWGEGVVGIVQSSFLWGYLVTPVLGGALADRYGGTRVLATGMALWSAATALTPLAAAHSLPSLLATRALMGIGEGVALPCMNNMISKWVPKAERARAISVSMAGFHLGSMFGLLAAPVLMSSLGLNGPFFVFSLLGFCWLATWTLSIVPDPTAHPSISPSELAYILGPNKSNSSSKGDNGSVSHSFQQRELAVAGGEGGQPTEGTLGAAPGAADLRRQGPWPLQGRLPPFRRLLSKMPTWALIVANCVNNWGYFVLLSWMPVYFNKVLGVDLREAAWFSALPWAVMAATGFGAAAVADALTTRGMRTTHVRKIMQTIGFAGPAVALALLGSASNAGTGAAILTGALALSAFSQSGFLVNYQDIGPRYAGVLHGMANTAGTVAGILSTASTGFLIESTGSFHTPLALCCLLYAFAVVFWNLFSTGDQVFD